eukprot:GEMP01044843.1.p1 GENE.GEMP01044843.1~~GEMP01044843.1.p1  ORF type:complete len:335 (+),score=24.46 GEMP01044843.1:24-1007(+)
MGRVRLGNALKNVLKKKGVCASLFLAVTGYVFVVSSLTLPWAQVDINMSYPVVSFDIYLHSLKVSQRTGFYEFIKSVVKNHETLKDALESLTGMLSIGHTRNLICGVITDGLVFAWLDVLCQELAAEEHAGIAVIIIVTIATSLEVVACGLLCYHAFVRPRRSLRKKCLVLFSVSPSMLVVAVVLYAFANGLFLSYDLAYGIDIDIEQGRHWKTSGAFRRRRCGASSKVPKLITESRSWSLPNVSLDGSSFCQNLNKTPCTVPPVFTLYPWRRRMTYTPSATVPVLRQRPATYGLNMRSNSLLRRRMQCSMAWHARRTRTQSIRGQM